LSGDVPFQAAAGFPAELSRQSRDRLGYGVSYRVGAVTGKSRSVLDPLLFWVTRHWWEV